MVVLVLMVVQELMLLVAFKSAHQVLQVCLDLEVQVALVAAVVVDSFVEHV